MDDVNFYLKFKILNYCWIIYKFFVSVKLAENANATINVVP